MLCEKCGAQYPDDAEKCPFCDAGEEKTAVEEKVAVEEIADAEEVAEVIEEVAEPAIEIGNDAPKKSKKGLWALIIAVVVVIIAAAAFFIASNMYYTTANAENASVYTVVKKDTQKVYAKVGDGEAFLVKELATQQNGQTETFTQGKDFIVKNNNLYFYNDDGGLSLMNMKNGKVKLISEELTPGTMIISAKGDTVLFVGVDGDLYKTIKGGEAKFVAELGQTTFLNGMPAYNFVEGTNAAWYAVRETEEAATASVYLESGDLLADKVSCVFYVGDEGTTSVYSVVTSEETVEVPAPAAEEGEEPAEPQTIVNREYALVLKENGEAKTLTEEYVEGMDSVNILHKGTKGVCYIADKGEEPKDEETGEVIGMATGTLYFQPFGGGEKVALDTEVSVAVLVEELAGSNYYFDGSDRAEDETIAYMKDNTISMIKDFKVVENPSEFEFLSSNPKFGKNNTFMMYYTYNPAPVKEEPAEETAEEATEEKPEEEVPPVKLVYTTFADGKWAEPTVIAEGVLDYTYNEATDKIYYMIQEGETSQQLTLYVYDVATGSATALANDVLGYVTISEDGKNVYFVNGYNSETQMANVSTYVDGAAKVIFEGITGFVASEDGTPYLVAAEGEKTDLYYVDGAEVKLVTSNMKAPNYYR